MTVGPWKPIRLETYTTRIADLDVRPRVDEKLCADVDIAFELSNSSRSIATVSVNGPDGKLVIGQTDLAIQSERAEAHFKLSAGAFDLWFPVGYGKQPIYTVEIKITDKVRVIRQNDFSSPEWRNVFPRMDIFSTPSLKSSPSVARSSSRMSLRGKKDGHSYSKSITSGFSAVVRTM